jgi:hypothetical protein
MMIIGCDFHPRYQQIAMLNTETGELVERRLEHENGEARAFYARLPKPARVGMEATGYGQWFERMLAEQGHELWIGHARQLEGHPGPERGIDFLIGRLASPHRRGVRNTNHGLLWKIE